MKRQTRNTLKLILLAGGLYWGLTEISEIGERHHYWNIARRYCDSVGKPLLRIGIRRNPLEPPNGDVTLDIDERVLAIDGGVLGDIRDMPFNNKEMGVCFSEHVIEHLYNSEDVEMAIKECVRVADYAVILAPGPYTVGGYFHPDHKMRFWFYGNEQILAQNIPYIQGWQNLSWPGINGIGQAMVLKDEIPEIRLI